ncbi:MAG: aldose 1-epimerase family protein [Propionibacteriaceae bacterium]
MSVVPPSGEQFEIRAGEHRATIVEVGGGIRTYAVGDREVLEPYALDAVCDGAHGAPLIPWPNRLADGAYTFDGTDQQVALTEPGKHTAIHGFLRWRNWRAVEQEPNRVVMSIRLHPLMGYPHVLDVQVDYTLSDTQGLTVTTTATNRGDRACPYGVGQHPYLSPGRGRLDDCTLQLQAATWIDTDNERQLPAGRKPTAGTALDFSAGRPLGDQQLDFPFTELTRDDDQRAWVRLTAPDHSRAELWVDDCYPIVELFTGDTLAPDRRRRGLGSEPMSCPPNAFQTGDGVLRLEPGESTSHSWGAHLA